MIRIIRILASAAILTWLLCSTSSAQCRHGVHGESPACGVVDGDEVWLINARDSDGSLADSVHVLDYWQYDGRAWSGPGDESQFCASVVQATLPTVVFVHGYQTDLDDAQRRGVQVYRNLFPPVDRPSVRFVIWAWRSEKELCRPIPDFMLKSRRADHLGDVFALNMNMFGTKPLVVVSYSLGTQIVVSGLTQSDLYRGLPIQFAVIAAATDCGLGSCCEPLWKCGNIERSYIFTNRGDRAIRVAKFTCRIAEGRQYRGFDELAPLYSQQLGDVRLIDLSNVASRKHSITRYTSLPIVQSSIRQLVERSASASQYGVFLSPASRISADLTPRVCGPTVGATVCTLR